MEITKEQFDQQRRPRFGKANPERMQFAFWEWMIKGEESAPTDGEGGLAGLGFMLRDGKLKSSYGPYRARDLFKVPFNREDGSVWTFDRMGATRSALPDGRVVCVGGEYEDFYDPDFCIYNDVVVFGPADQIEIYGYPKEVFPPTDFHTASILSERIIIVGGLGYRDARRAGHTPVYALDLSGYRLSEIETSGEMPGWVFKHEAEIQTGGTIIIRSGEVIEDHGGEQRYRRNVEDYALDIKSGAWRRLTNRNWRQFAIRQEDSGFFAREHGLRPENLVPRSLMLPLAAEEEWRRAQILVQGVPVSIIVGVRYIELIVEGELPSDVCTQVTEQVRINAEAAIKRPCIVEER